MKKKQSSTHLKKAGRSHNDSNQSDSSSTDSARSRSRGRFWFISGIGSALVLLVGVGLLANRWIVESQIAELRRSCDQAVSEFDWPNLERIAREWAVLEPNSVRPWTMAASASRAMGDLKGCAQYLSQLPDSAPVEAFHELSLLQMEFLVQPLAARETCERTLRIYPKDKESSLRLLFIHAMLCHRNKITSEAKRALQAGADSRATYAYLFTANWITFANGSKLNRFWLELDPQNEDFQVAALTHEALYRVTVGVHTSSDSETTNPDLPRQSLQSQLDELRTRFPNNVELRMISLSKHLQAGQVTELGELLELPSEKLMADNRYWRYKGWYLADREQWPAAIEAYRKALSICSFDISSQNELAGILRRTQGLEASQEIQAKANLGIELELAFLRAPNFEAVSQTDFLRLADYFKLCDETDFSNGLRKHHR